VTVLRRVGLPVIALLAVLLAGTTSAWAYWRAAGTGTGRAAVDRLAIEVQAPDGPNAALLLPGGTGDALVRVHNAGTVPVTVISVQPNGVPVAGNGCTPTGVGFTGRDGLDWPIPAGGTVTRSLPGTVRMALDAAAGCQGTSFAIPVTVTVRSLDGTRSTGGRHP